MRRLLAASAAVALALGLSLVAAPANAVEPPPGPVVDFPDLPSRTAGYTTGSSMMDDVMGQLWRVMTGRETVSVGTPAAPSVKPLTPTQLISRSGGAAGAAVAAGNVGWALGQGGLVLYGVATGTTYDRIVCSQPSWYQAANSFLTLGLASPDCTASLDNPNAGAQVSMASTFGGWSYSTGSAKFGTWSLNAGVYSIPVDVYCYTASGTYDTVLYSQRWVLDGAVTVSSTGGGVRWGTYFNCAGVTNGGANYIRTDQGTPNAPRLEIYRRSTGVTVSTYTQTSANPERTPRCKIKWEDGTTTTGTGTKYKETAGIPLSAAGLGCESAYVSKPGRGPSLLPDRITVESEDDAGSITTISDQDVPGYTAPQRSALEPGDGTGLRLWKVAGTTTSSCMTWAADCSGWWASTSSGTVPDVYRCTFAGNAVDLSECGVYRYTFDVQTSTPTITNPSTGAEVGWSAQPSTGNSINPGTGPGTGANPADQCFATGWASVANPIDWVLVPIKCALVWAFVPRQSAVEAAQDGMTTAFEGSVLGSVSGGLAILADAYQGGQGCGGLPFHLEFGGGVSVHTQLLESCSEPAAGIAATVRTILMVSIGIGAVLATIRYLGAVFAFTGFGRTPDDSGGVKFK